MLLMKWMHLVFVFLLIKSEKNIFFIKSEAVTLATATSIFQPKFEYPEAVVNLNTKNNFNDKKKISQMLRKCNNNGFSNLHQNEELDPDTIKIHCCKKDNGNVECQHKTFKYVIKMNDDMSLNQEQLDRIIKSVFMYTNSLNDNDLTKFNNSQPNFNSNGSKAPKLYFFGTSSYDNFEHNNSTIISPLEENFQTEPLFQDDPSLGNDKNSHRLKTIECSITNSNEITDTDNSQKNLEMNLICKFIDGKRSETPTFSIPVIQNYHTANNLEEFNHFLPNNKASLEEICRNFSNNMTHRKEKRNIRFWHRERNIRKIHSNTKHYANRTTTEENILDISTKNKNVKKNEIKLGELFPEQTTTTTTFTTFKLPFNSIKGKQKVSEAKNAKNPPGTTIKTKKEEFKTWVTSYFTLKTQKPNMFQPGKDVDNYKHPVGQSDFLFHSNRHNTTMKPHRHDTHTKPRKKKVKFNKCKSNKKNCINTSIRKSNETDTDNNITACTEEYPDNNNDGSLSSELSTAEEILDIPSEKLLFHWGQRKHKSQKENSRKNIKNVRKNLFNDICQDKTGLPNYKYKSNSQKNIHVQEKHDILDDFCAAIENFTKPEYKNSPGIIYVTAATFPNNILYSNQYLETDEDNSYGSERHNYNTSPGINTNNEDTTMAYKSFIKQIKSENTQEEDTNDDIYTNNNNEDEENMNLNKINDYKNISLKERKEFEARFKNCKNVKYKNSGINKMHADISNSQSDYDCVNEVNSQQLSTTESTKLNEESLQSSTQSDIDYLKEINDELFTTSSSKDIFLQRPHNNHNNSNKKHSNEHNKNKTNKFKYQFQKKELFDYINELKNRKNSSEEKNIVYSNGKNQMRKTTYKIFHQIRRKYHHYKNN